MSETLWTHLGIVGAILLPLFAFWWDGRKENRKRHEENLIRLTAIETQLEPITKWFNEVRSNGR